MRVTTPVLAAIGALALAGGALVVAPAALATSQPPAAVSTVRSCARPTAPHVMACHSLRRTDIAAPLAIAPKASPAGYGPSSLQSAYNLTGTAASTGAGRTVAIVDAYDDPNAAADLATYRSQFGLPACTTSNGCFRKVSQNGSTSLPGADSGWAGEISLDLDMVSAVCPRCNILLVEANSANDTDLYTAEDYAAAHAGYVSNSWGGNETSNQTSRFDSHFNHPGVAITVSSGDSGTGAEYPATSRYVTAVGGTSLSTASNGRGWSEKAWTDAGSGCSAYDAKPSWQTANTNCSRRAEADVSAVADPRTGVAVYQTYGASGWSVYGGTSASAPIIAAVYALAGTVGSADYAASYPYAHSGNLNDVTSGANGSCGAPMCTSAGGWDGPSGLGTPNGVAAFTAGTVTPPPTTPPTTAPPTTVPPTTVPPTTAPPTTQGPGGACGASYRTVGSWPGGFQGEVTVTAGASAISGWTVRWTLGSGQTITQVWSGTLTTSGSSVSVGNASYNGSLQASASTTFGFLANGTPSAVALTCSSP